MCLLVLYCVCRTFNHSVINPRNINVSVPAIQFESAKTLLDLLNVSVLCVDANESSVAPGKDDECCTRGDNKMESNKRPLGSKKRPRHRLWTYQSAARELEEILRLQGSDQATTKASSNRVTGQLNAACAKSTGFSTQAFFGLTD